MCRVVHPIPFFTSNKSKTISAMVKGMLFKSQSESNTLIEKICLP